MPDKFFTLFGQDRWRSAQDVPWIREVWYGQTDLLTMIWFLGIVVRGVFIVLCGEAVFSFAGMVLGNPFPLYLFVALLFPEEIWYMVGLWRSAANNRGPLGTIVKYLLFVWVPLEACAFLWLFLLYRATLASDT
jgi:hypothetical protein